MGLDAEWERKQRLREYRVAARREKRNRKADEKKQRKLNATILRRMVGRKTIDHVRADTDLVVQTRNPDKYNKNTERNRLRAIDAERWKIWNEGIKQAQRLAAIHDPTGAMFNVDPVTTQVDGSVISLETLRRRQEREAAAQAKKDGLIAVDDALRDGDADARRTEPLSVLNAVILPQNGINHDRKAYLDVG